MNDECRRGDGATPEETGIARRFPPRVARVTAPANVTVIKLLNSSRISNAAFLFFLFSPPLSFFFHVIAVIAVITTPDAIPTLM